MTGEDVLLGIAPTVALATALATALASGSPVLANRLRVGLAGRAVGTGVLRPARRRPGLGETLGTLARTATVILVPAGCDTDRDDTEPIAAVITGPAVTISPGPDTSTGRPFLETPVQVVIGPPFVPISSAVTAASVTPALAPSPTLIAVLALAVRPLVAFAPARGPGLTAGDALLGPA